MGACILETSKLHMYEFWYDHLKEKYNDKIQLIYTDSFVIEINTDDIYKDMFENKDLYVNGKRHKMMNLTIRLKALNEAFSFVKSWLYNTGRFDHDIDHPQLKTETLYIFKRKLKLKETDKIYVHIFTNK